VGGRLHAMNTTRCQPCVSQLARLGANSASTPRAARAAALLTQGTVIR
jgi:hypothetical protein